jgi:hypothetical protein
MDPVIALDQNTLTVEPGNQARLTVRVHNNNNIVEGYRVVVLGEASPWARVTPEELSVYPQDDAEAQIVFSPPATGLARAGLIPFGVQVVSRLDPMSAAVAEGDITVGTVTSLNAQLVPVASSGRWSGKHHVEIANWGNAPVRLALDATDPEQKLAFLVQPSTVDLSVGAKATVRVKVRTRTPFLRGPAVRRSFRLVGRPAGPDGRAVPTPPNPGGWLDPSHVAVDGAFTQKAVLGKGATVLGAAVLLALAVGVAAALRGGGGDDDAGPTNVAPEPVTDLAVAGHSTNSISLTWSQVRNIDGYELLRVDPTTKTEQRPRAIETYPPIDKDLEGREVPDLDAGTEYCFQIRTKRGEAPSALSSVVCDTTEADATTPPPDPPTDLNGKLVNGKVELNWTRPDPNAQVIVFRDSKELTTVNGEIFQDDAGQKDNCWVLRSVKDNQRSATVSNTWCWTDETVPTTTGGGGPGGPAEPLQFAVLFNAVSLERGDAQAAIEQAQQRYRDEQQIEAQILNSNEHPELKPIVTNASMFLYIEFPDRDAAVSFCTTRLNSNCRVFPPT